MYLTHIVFEFCIIQVRDNFTDRFFRAIQKKTNIARSAIRKVNAKKEGAHGEENSKNYYSSGDLIYGKYHKVISKLWILEK